MKNEGILCPECQFDKDMKIRIIKGKKTLVCPNCQYKEWVNY